MGWPGCWSTPSCAAIATTGSRRSGLTKLYREGDLNPRAAGDRARETEGALLLDGDRGCGPGAPARAMEWCIERALERKGMAVAAVRDWQLLVAAPMRGWRRRPG